MLDLHVHLLPGIDDGPKTLDDALRLARAMLKEGVQHVVATPHIYPGVYDNTLENITETYHALVAALELNNLPLILSMGAEVRLCGEMLEWLGQGRLPFLGGMGAEHRTVLVELPDSQIPLGTEKLLGLLLERGVTPLIAHPERNRAVAEQVERMRPFVQMGCKLQVTAASLLGEFGSRAEKASLELMDAGWVEVVASDAHNLTGRRPRLGAAREWLTERYGRELAEALTEHNPARLAGVGELAVLGRDGMTLRDLPQGQVNAAQAKETRRTSVLELLTDMPGAMGPGSGTGVMPTAAEAAAATQDHGIWSLADFGMPAAAQAQGQASAGGAATPKAQAAPPQPDFADWTMPMSDLDMQQMAYADAAKLDADRAARRRQRSSEKPQPAAPVAAAAPEVAKAAEAAAPVAQPAAAAAPDSAAPPARPAVSLASMAADAWPAETLAVGKTAAGPGTEPAREAVKAAVKEPEPEQPGAAAEAPPQAGERKSRWSFLRWMGRAERPAPAERQEPAMEAVGTEETAETEKIEEIAGAVAAPPAQTAPAPAQAPGPGANPSARGPALPDMPGLQDLPELLDVVQQQASAAPARPVAAKVATHLVDEEITDLVAHAPVRPAPPVRQLAPVQQAPVQPPQPQVLKQPQPPREPAPAQAQQPTPARAPTGISLQALEVIHETVRSGLDSRPAALKTEAGSATAAGAAGNAAAMPGHDAAHRPRGGRMGNGLAHKSMPTAPLNGSAPAPADGPAMRRPAPMVVTGTAEAARSGFRLSDIAPLQPAEPQRMAQGGARR